MKAKPHYQRLHGFALPLVISVLEEIGMPSAITKVSNERQQGPLLVTLATELACVIVGLLHQSLAWGIELEELDAFFQIRGGEEFQKLYKRAQKLHSSKEAMIAAGTKLENRILRFGAGDLSITGRKAEKDPKSLWKGRIVWSQPLGTQAKSWRTAYEQLAEQYHLEWKELTEMETRLSELRTKLLSAPDFLEEFERHLASRGFQPGKKKQLPVQFQIDANFDGAHPLLTDGAPAILMRTDRKWWKIFERRIKSEMKSSAIIRIMLRDVILDRVTILLASRSHYIRDKGWIDLLNDPSKAPKTLKELWDQFDSGQKLHTSFEGLSCVFPGNLHLASYDGRSGKINDDDVRFWRSILRKEDSKAQDWIARHGGEYHPCNWYIFKDDLNALSATRLRNARANYPLERAANELYWCLCETSKQSFNPMASKSYGVEHWRDWIRNAEAHSPEYWQRKSK